MKQIYDGNNIYKIDFKEDVVQLSLRYTLPKNNQLENIMWAKDYILE